MASHPDLQSEQAYLDHAYERLEVMRASAQEMLASALDQGGGGTPQARAERDVIVRSSLQRLQQLDVADGRSLCFGRIDLVPSGPGDVSPGDAFYIGRLAVSGESLEPLVVDWRAPVAEPFYRATGRDPMGLTRRRHFATTGRKLLGIEDELFGLPRSRGSGLRDGEGGGLEGPEVDGRERPREALAASTTLLAALERSRTTHMTDIVATVQAEQDEIIRAPLPGVMVVQGGPGTGKTAVALHRAAYLLYTHRFPLERQGVLVVGPNQVFLSYIGQVLPSLGESGVAMSTVSGLAPAEVRSTEPASLALLKGDARMAEVVANAVSDRERPLPRDVRIPFGSVVLPLTREDSSRLVANARRRAGTHNAKRRYVERRLTDLLAQRYLRATGRIGSTREQPDLDVEDLGRQLRNLEPVAETLRRIWPRLTPEELLHDLFGAEPLIALAGRGVLARQEEEALFRPRSSVIGDIPWTAADLALLDEARVLLGASHRQSDEDEPATYGHIVVDEAQDLSPMQLRMLGRRSLSGSMTVVGDIAQATGPRAPISWDEVTRHLPRIRPARVAELSVNYRTPAEVMDLASRVLAMTAPELDPPRSVRVSGATPLIEHTAPGDLARRAVSLASEALEAVAGGTAGIITPASLLDQLAHEAGALGLPVSEASVHGLGERITLATVDVVKGLEFDAVVVVEPAEVADEIGLRGLYVAISRPTRRLNLVHSRPLPPALGDRPAPGRSDVPALAPLD